MLDVDVLVRDARFPGCRDDEVRPLGVSAEENLPLGHVGHEVTQGRDVAEVTCLLGQPAGRVRRRGPGTVRTVAPRDCARALSSSPKTTWSRLWTR